VVLYAAHELIELGVVPLDIAATEDALFHVLGKGLLQWPPGNADNREVLGQQPAGGVGPLSAFWRRKPLEESSTPGFTPARGPATFTLPWPQMPGTRKGQIVDFAPAGTCSRRAHAFPEDHYLGDRAERDHRVLDSMVTSLLEDAKKLSLVPFSSLLEGFPKLVRDVCRERGKEADLVIKGGEIETDR